MNSPGKYDLQSFLHNGEDISVSRSFIIQAEESFAKVSLQNKGQESDEETCPEELHDGSGESHEEFPQGSVNASSEETGSMGASVAQCRELDPDCLLNKEEHFITENYARHPYYPNLTENGDISLQSENCVAFSNYPNLTANGDSSRHSAGEWNAEKEDPMNRHIFTKESDAALTVNNENNTKVLDPQKGIIKVSETILPHKATAHHYQNGDSGAKNLKEGRYFYYDAPLYEDTGLWIPVSVPPMSEREHEEWTKGFCSNGGYIPGEDMGWSECFGEDKELTMWDVVLEMLLVARGKVTSITSGDIGQLSWISTHLIEQTWKDMAHTLTEATISNTQEILDSEPPKWLPDSTASCCMLCNVRFHPIMCTRHHCRFCGGIFCGECSKGRSLLPEKFRTQDPQRVCDVCCVRLESVQPYLMDRVSCAAQLPTHDLTDLSTLRSWVNFPWGQSMEYEIYKAANTIHGYSKVGSLRPEKRIPETILQNAKGLAILTVAKVGVMVTYNIGTGLIVARREDGSWSPPSAISSFGLGWGAQAGGELTDFVIVLRTNEAVETFSSDAHISLGAGLSAAVGIIGRTAEADMRVGGGGISACYTYSSSKGAFIGCSLEGSVVTTRARENSRFYGSQSITASEILLGSLPQPPAAATLYRALGDLFLQLER